MRLTNRDRTGHVQAAASRLGRSRPAFTLVELLVVIAIMIVLASLTLLFLPNQNSKLAANGAGQLQTWLASARSRALRDQTPTGIRLVSGSTAGQYTSVQLIQSPEPLAPQSTMTVAAGSTTATFSPALPTPVNVGDMLEIVYGTGSIHRVVTATSTSSVTLASSPPAAALSPLTLGPTNPPYRFIRQPLPLMGEPALDLPSTVYIMGNSGAAPGSQNVPTSYSGTNVDIIFAPSGQVINATTGRIVFWVTDTNNVSKPTLVTVYTRTGAVAVHPVGPAGQEYLYTQDGQSSGQ